MTHLFVGHVFNREQIDDLRPAVRAGIPMDGAEIWFADEHPGTGSLYHKVTAGIEDSFACMFEITDTTRANVFLELGFALAKEKPCVLICRKGTQVPVDIAGFERLEYESYADLTRQLKTTIGKRLGGTPISKALVLTLADGPDERETADVLRECLERGETASEAEESLSFLAADGILSIEGRHVVVLRRNKLEGLAQVARA
jgi:hypothetical protein